jgi:hypothetical protein
MQDTTTDQFYVGVISSGDDDDIAWNVKLGTVAGPYPAWDRDMAPNEARDLAAALVQAAQEAEDPMLLSSPAELVAEVLAVLRGMPTVVEARAWDQTLWPNLVAAHERLTGRRP